MKERPLTEDIDELLKKLFNRIFVEPPAVNEETDFQNIRRPPFRSSIQDADSLESLNGD